MIRFLCVGWRSSWTVRQGEVSLAGRGKLDEEAVRIDWLGLSGSRFALLILAIIEYRSTTMSLSVTGEVVACEVALDRPPFSRRAKQSLCEELLDLPYMQNRENRDFLVRELSREFRGLRAVVRSDDPFIDLMEIISTAYEHPGALRTVNDIVSAVYKGDPKLDAVKSIVDLVDPDDLLNAKERQALLRWLQAVEPDVAEAAFYYGTGATVLDRNLDPADMRGLVEEAESYAARPGQLPVLFQFTDHVAHRSPQFTRAALHRWMDEVDRRIGHADRTAVDKMCLATDNRIASSGRFYLVAELRPDHLRADRFFLAAWRQHEDEAEETLYQSDLSVDWDEAITITHDLMHQMAMSLQGAAEEQVLELIVPRRLVTHAIDQRQVDAVMPAAIGTNYPLVLRSFDRLADLSLHGVWARNWRWIKQHDRTAGIDAVHEVESHELETVQALRGALIGEGPPAIVLMLTALPPSEGLRVDAYTAGLRGGAPIMLWSRDDAAVDELVKAVRAACLEGLLSLRDHIFQLRLNSLGDSATELAGRHTAIVFDDYDRVPERFRGRARLRSPHNVEAQ